MKYSKEVKVGFFVVLVLVISFFVINYLRGTDIFNKEYDYVAYFDNTQGLTESAPVFINGYKAGKVVEVVPCASGRQFKVICSVDKRFKIPTDSKMTIYPDGIMGAVSVKIDYGQSSENAGDGATLTANVEKGMIEALSANAAETFAKVNAVLDGLTQTLANVDKILNEENKAHIATILADLETSVKGIATIVGTVENRSADIDSFITELGELSAKLSAIADKADTTIDGVNDAVGVVTDKINEADIAGVINSLHEVLNKINDPNGTVGKLLVDDSVYNSLDSLLIDVDSLIKKIEKNPKKYMKLSVF